MECVSQLLQFPKQCAFDLLERDVSALLEQLGLDNSFFIEFVIIGVLFFILSNLYFRPFLKLFQARYKRTVEDKEAAEKLLAQAHSKFDEYKRLLGEEQIAAKKSFNLALLEAKKQETKILAEAREAAKKITQDAIASVHFQREQLKRHLEGDLATLSDAAMEQLLARKR